MARPLRPWHAGHRYGAITTRRTRAADAAFPENCLLGRRRVNATVRRLRIAESIVNSMSEQVKPLQSQSGHRLRISLTSVFCLLLIAVLVITNLVTGWRLLRIQRELSAYRPLPPKEVARQFEENTTLGRISTKVVDVRYSADKDAYRVAFSWRDTKAAETWYSEVDLASNGYGLYGGVIRSDAFVQPLERESYSVAVQTPSPLSD